MYTSMQFAFEKITRQLTYTKFGQSNTHFWGQKIDVKVTHFTTYPFTASILSSSFVMSSYVWHRLLGSLVYLTYCIYCLTTVSQWASSEGITFKIFTGSFCKNLDIVKERERVYQRDNLIKGANGNDEVTRLPDPVRVERSERGGSQT